MIYTTKRFSINGGEYVEFIDEKGKVIGKNGKTQYLKTAKNKTAEMLKTKKGKAIAGGALVVGTIGAGVAASKKKKEKKYSVTMTEAELTAFSEYLEEKNYAFTMPNLSGMAKTATEAVKNTWNSGALGKAKVAGGATALAGGAYFGGKALFGGKKEEGEN